MNTETKKAILVVSFGTSFADTRAKTIDAIEQDIADAFPEYQVYRAWTSKMIIAKLKRLEQLHVFTVCEAMEQMYKDGIREVIVQPTHVINGNENDIMKKEAGSFMDKFDSIQFGSPLLTSDEDLTYVLNSITEEFADFEKNRTAIVLMGHGTTHYSNTVYAAMDYRFKDMGHPHVFLGTVEAYPSSTSVLRLLGNYQPKSVVLAPFMIVAGDHARNDLAGDDPDSWLHQFERAGYEVTTSLKGLGEYPSIRQLFIDHVNDVIENRE
ncbi:MAG: sirohydrochlorin cobaltochelatase [Eubacteriales bacterium]|nr:sirohydrochlorin cobaltochelatase [Eubacteriales bacterium]